MGFAKAVRTDRTLEVVDQLLATASDAMVIIGADGRIVRVNTRAEKLFGYPQHQVLGQKHDFLITWPHRVRKHQAGNGKRPKVRLFGYGVEGVAHRPDGGQFPIAVNLGLLDVRTDTLISHAIQKTQREHGEDLDLRAIVDASDDAIIGTDFDGTIVSWNKGAEKITGYSAEEVLGRPVTVLTPPSYLDEFSRNIRRLQRGEHIERFETTRIHKDGHPVDVSVTISPVRNRSGMVVGASVVARDITEHKEAQSF
jgi:PAS domain S-box-containing protein